MDTNKPKEPGDAFRFAAVPEPIYVIIEHVIGDTATIRFLDDCQSKAKLPLGMFDLHRSISVEHFGKRTTPMFLIGPGEPLCTEEVQKLIENRKRELWAAAEAAQRTMHAYDSNSHEIHTKFLKPRA